MGTTHTPILLTRIIAVHDALDRAGFDHALGGALALAIHVREPRFTADIDLNVIADPDHPEALLECFPDDLVVPSTAADDLRQTGQTRLIWPLPTTPIDLFLPQDDTYHRLVNDRATPCAFGDALIKVVSATDLMVFKMMFDRPKDWVDIDSLLDAGAGDPEEAIEWISRFLGADDQRIARLRAMLTAARDN